ncbi:hypothetical protein F967_00225 [Acinetobacter sp. CIP 102637]|uniref:hypothetical protein n=1 Tax=Acinetobacter sp. CIP 102637 TaxID=1144669 RepID=UPI0002CE9460|nr:hypothetical protein [Acinetobacter sp. CIP 102637]ENV07244.1 hypothetical protein F967_00225 [Acinetobacter sp. CIP 102637]
MTKNVSFSSLSFMFESINLDYFLIVVKMSETNHKKILNKDQNFYQPFIGIRKMAIRYNLPHTDQYIYNPFQKEKQ